MASVEILGQTYELTDDPIHFIVREFKKKQKSMAVALLAKYKDQLTDKMTVDEALIVIAKMNPEEVAMFSDMQEEFNRISIISFATNKIWESDDISLVPEKKLREIVETCKQALGGDVKDFFKE